MEIQTAANRPRIYPLAGMNMRMMPAPRPPAKKDDGEEESSSFAMEALANMVLPGSQIVLEVTDALESLGKDDDSIFNYQYIKQMIAAQLFQRNKVQNDHKLKEAFHPA